MSSSAFTNAVKTADKPIESIDSGDQGYCKRLNDEIVNRPLVSKSTLPDPDYEPQAFYKEAWRQIIQEYNNPKTKDPINITTPGGQKIYLSQSLADCNFNKETAAEELKELDSSYERNKIIHGNNYYSIKGRLITDTLINQAWFGEKSWVSFYPNYALKAGRLLEKAELIPGVWFPQDTNVEFYNNETNYESPSLYSGTLLDNQTFKFYDNKLKIKFYAGQDIVFHENKKFKKGITTDDVLIPELGITLASNTEIEFYDTGEFKKGTLLKEKKLNGILIESNNRVVFHRSGEFMGSTLSQEKEFKTKYGTVILSKDKWFEFDEDKNLVEGQINESRKFKIKINETDSITIKNVSDTKIGFYQNGNIYRITPQKEVQIDGVVYAANHELLFHQNGNLKQGRLKYKGHIDKDYLNYSFYVAPNTDIEYFDNGQIKSCYLLEELVLDAKQDNLGPIVLSSNQKLYFRKGGHVDKGTLKENIEFEGFKLKEQTIIHFFDDESLRKGKLLEDTPIFEEQHGSLFTLAKDTNIRFRKNYKDEKELGGVLRFPVQFKAKINGASIKLAINAGQYIRFLSDGNVAGGLLMNRTALPNKHSNNIFLAEKRWFEVRERNEKKYIGGISDNSFNILGITIKKDSYFEVYESGYFKASRLLKEKEILPIKYPGLYFKAKGWFNLYDAQDLIDEDIISTDEEEDISKKAYFSGGRLHKDYQLYPHLYEDLWLAKDNWVRITKEQNIGGGRLNKKSPVKWPRFENLIFPKQSWVNFYPNGNLNSGKLAEDAVYDHPLYGNITLKADTWIAFSPDGSLSSGTLAESIHIKNERYAHLNNHEDLIIKEDKRIYFYDDYYSNRFRQGYLDEDYNVFTADTSQITLSKGFNIVFYPDQKIQQGSLDKDTLINKQGSKLWFQGGCEASDDYSESLCKINFRSDESFHGGHLGDDYTINGVEYDEGDWYEYDYDYGIE
ncbi:hypothetical protein BVY03_03925 [bacterium K02(2017)]|nr:hypothetical protein BVY03_03925 [bacterium K02(2017)]